MVYKFFQFKRSVLFSKVRQLSTDSILQSRYSPQPQSGMAALSIPLIVFVEVFAGFPLSLLMIIILGRKKDLRRLFASPIIHAP